MQKRKVIVEVRACAPASERQKSYMGKLSQNKRKRYDFFFLKDYLAKELIGYMAISAPITPYKPFG